MRTIRIFQAGNFTIGDCIMLSDEASRHVGSVLRCKAGDYLTLFSGDNIEFKSVIVALTKKQVEVRIKQAYTVNRESPLAIHLVQGLSKGDKMEWVIQKAVELGVASITPLITQHCAVKLDSSRLEKKRMQWQHIIISACEQCGRNKLPELNPFISFEDYNQLNHPGKNVVLSPINSSALDTRCWTETRVNLLIGPEGGFSSHELKELLARNFSALSLGPRILRTETAALAAIAILQSAGGDF